MRAPAFDSLGPREDHGGRDTLADRDRQGRLRVERRPGVQRSWRSLSRQMLPIVGFRPGSGPDPQVLDDHSRFNGPTGPAGFRFYTFRPRFAPDSPDRHPVTNVSVNPARSAGPAVFIGGWALSQLWLFWVAPSSEDCSGDHLPLLGPQRESGKGSRAVSVGE